MPRKILSGTVSKISDPSTVSVVVSSMVKHKVYKKIVTSTKKYSVHYIGNDIKVGDIVRFCESKPISKTKRWIIIE